MTAEGPGNGNEHIKKGTIQFLKTYHPDAWQARINELPSLEEREACLNHITTISRNLIAIKDDPTVRAPIFEGDRIPVIHDDGTLELVGPFRSPSGKSFLTLTSAAYLKLLEYVTEKRKVPDQLKPTEQTTPGSSDTTTGTAVSSFVREQARYGREVGISSLDNPFAALNSATPTRFREYPSFPKTKLMEIILKERETIDSQKVDRQFAAAKDALLGALAEDLCEEIIASVREHMHEATSTEKLAIATDTYKLIVETLKLPHVLIEKIVNMLNAELAVDQFKAPAIPPAYAGLPLPSMTVNWGRVSEIPSKSIHSSVPAIPGGSSEGRDDDDPFAGLGKPGVPRKK